MGGRSKELVFGQDRLIAVDENYGNIVYTREFESWLHGTGNKKMHSATKKVPAEVFETERKYLIPVPKINNSLTQIIARTVRKDNTVIYEGNRYKVPLGTFKVHNEVYLDIKDRLIFMYDIFGDTFIVQHKISQGKGKFIRNNNHLSLSDNFYGVVFQI